MSHDVLLSGRNASRRKLALVASSVCVLVAWVWALGTSSCSEFSPPPETKQRRELFALPRGDIRRIHIDGKHGDYGFFVRAQHVCTKGLDMYLGPLIYHDDRADAENRLNKTLPLLWPFGSVNEHRPIRFGFSFQHVQPVSTPILMPEECVFKGSTVVIENSVGAPGHIGHFSETTAKFFAWVDQYIGRDQVSMVWATGLSTFPKTDWERHFAAASIGVLARNESLPPTLDTTSALAHAKRHNCRRLCFEDSYWSQVVQQWQMSHSNADLVRERTWRYCGITSRDTSSLHEQPDYKPVFVFLPRYKTRVVINEQDILGWATAAGFDVPKPVANLTDFCAQVALMESADVVFSMHSSALVNTMFMHPNTVVIEGTNRNFYWPCFKVIAVHSRLTYLEWNNKHAHLQMNITHGKNDNLNVSQDFRPYLHFARKVVGSDYWKEQTCNRVKTRVNHNEPYTEYNFKRCDPSATYQ